MSFLDLANERKSVRKYERKQIEPEKVEAILEAMRLAPSARNNQFWHFTAVTDLDKVRDMAEKMGHSFALDASCIIVVSYSNSCVMTNGHRNDSIDGSIALTFGMLEATELGLGSCWIASYKEDAVREMLGLPETDTIPAILIVGYSAEDPVRRPRKPLSEVATII